MPTIRKISDTQLGVTPDEIIVSKENLLREKAGLESRLQDTQDRINTVDDKLKLFD